MPTPDQIRKAIGDPKSPAPPSILDVARSKQAPENETAILNDPSLSQSVIAEKSGLQAPVAPTTPSILDVTRADRTESIRDAIAQDPALTFSPIAEKTGQTTILPQQPTETPAAITADHTAAVPTIQTLRPIGRQARDVPVQDMVRKLSSGAGQASLNRGPANPTVQAVAKEAATNPSFADMLKKIGFNVANLVQSAAYGATGNQAPNLVDVQQGKEFELKKAKAQADIAAQQNAVEQKYTLDRIQAQAEYQASNNKEGAKVILENRFQEIEAEKNARLQEIAVQNKGRLQEIAASNKGSAAAGQNTGALINKSLSGIGLGGGS